MRQFYGPPGAETPKMCVFPAKFLPRTLSTDPRNGPKQFRTHDQNKIRNVAFV
jgi:hypothetical protein